MASFTGLVVNITADCKGEIVDCPLDFTRYNFAYQQFYVKVITKKYSKKTADYLATLPQNEQGAVRIWGDRLVQNIKTDTRYGNVKYYKGYLLAENGNRINSYVVHIHCKNSYIFGGLRYYVDTFGVVDWLV